MRLVLACCVTAPALYPGKLGKVERRLQALDIKLNKYIRDVTDLKHKAFIIDEKLDAIVNAINRAGDSQNDNICKTVEAEREMIDQRVFFKTELCIIKKTSQ